MTRANDVSEDFTARRNAWLRQQNRTPLRQRFQEVFGDEGRTLHDQMRKAHKEGEGVTGEAFQRYARAVLRACADIPLEKGGRQRRHQYCVKSIKNLTAYKESPDEDEVISGREMMALIAKKARCSVNTVWTCVFALSDLYYRRWPNSDDRPASAVHTVLKNALAANFPLRYLKVVVRNERERVTDKSG